MGAEWVGVWGWCRLSPKSALVLNQTSCGLAAVPAEGEIDAFAELAVVRAAPGPADASSGLPCEILNLPDGRHVTFAGFRHEVMKRPLAWRLSE